MLAPSVLAFHARPDHDEKYLAETISEGLPREDTRPDTVTAEVKSGNAACQMGNEACQPGHEAGHSGN